jgi:hypothetical protein
MASGTCSSCGAEVMWLKTPRGKTIPIDPMPLPGGNIILADEGAVTFLSRMQITEMKESGDLAYQSHFVTCPDAELHRKR